jgi:hypothetical protein
MYYEIDDEFAVRIFNDGDSIPFWFQPDYPNEDTFDSREEAETWAKLAIAAYYESQPAPPIGKGLKGEMRKRLTADEAISLLG